MGRKIAAGRKAREIDPALAALRDCLADSDGDSAIHPVAVKRLKQMLAFTETVDRWYGQILKVPQSKLAATMRLGAKVIDFLPVGKAK